MSLSEVFYLKCSRRNKFLDDSRKRQGSLKKIRDENFNSIIITIRILTVPKCTFFRVWVEKAQSKKRKSVGTQAPGQKNPWDRQSRPPCYKSLLSISRV